MSEELQQPAVVDLPALTQPIPGENPSGQYLRYSGLYDEVGEARRRDDDANQGVWQTELKVANYRRVIELVTPALTTQTKDLQLTVWLTEALIKEYGFAGLRDGLKLLQGLQETFWDTLHPEIDEGDMEGRANAISWLDEQGIFAVKSAPYTGGLGYGFQDWEDSKTFDYPESFDGMAVAEIQRLEDLKKTAEAGRRVTAEMWRKEIAETRRAAVEKANFVIEECFTALGDLNRVIEEKFDRNQTPGLNTLKKTLDEIHEQVKKLLEAKRAEEPDAVYDDATEGDGAASGDGTGRTGGGAATGAIQNRQDALKRLAEIADYFQRTEPHSPVSYLVQRGVKWGNMPLETWLQDVIKDDSTLSSLRQTLGFNTGGGENPQG
jgi:type VI secretion system protein ImpA